MPRKKYKLTAGNIKSDPACDPFPKSGRVKQYEPFIRKKAGEWYKKYRWLRYDEILFELVQIAVKVEPKFKPERGYQFSRFLEPYFQRIHRLAEREARLRHINVALLDGGYQKAQEAREAEEAKLPPGTFPPGANGARVTLDFQSMVSETRRRRTTLRVQLGSVLADHVLPLWNRASPDARLLSDHRSETSVRYGWLRAVLDHHERRQDEIEQEAENQRGGDYNPVFLGARPKTGGIDIRQCKGREPPRLLPDHLPVVSLGDAYSHDDEWVGSLAHTIAAGGMPDSPELAVIEAINAERPFLTPIQTAIADWMLGLFSGTEERSQGQLADDVGKTEGYVSKQRKQVEEKVKKRLEK
jgi:hypothetical protein